MNLIKASSVLWMDEIAAPMALATSKLSGITSGKLYRAAAFCSQVLAGAPTATTGISGVASKRGNSSFIFEGHSFPTDLKRHRPADWRLWIFVLKPVVNYAYSIEYTPLCSGECQ